MGSGIYLIILAVGIAIVAVDGQVILRKAPDYLDEVYDDHARSRKVTAMVVALFHLIMLGLVALVSSVGLAADAGIQSVVARVGVLLLLTALGHGITMIVLSRLREEELATKIADSASAPQSPSRRADR
jgi:hypothetical protein